VQHFCHVASFLPVVQFRLLPGPRPSLSDEPLRLIGWTLERNLLNRKRLFGLLNYFRSGNNRAEGKEHFLRTDGFTFAVDRGM
jgi:hypothetical protein